MDVYLNQYGTGVSDTNAASVIDAADLRKGRGAFFTPATICRYLAGWAIRSPADTVLEPSCGEAAFLLAAGDRLRALGAGPWIFRQLGGVEIHERSATNAAVLLATTDTPAELLIGDFLATKPAAVYDAVLGNPPYVRYQDFSGGSRSRSQAVAAVEGVKLSGLASSWAAFVVHAAQYVRRPTGRLGLVLPAELLTVNYAGSVRAFLLERFAHVRLVMFDQRVFPGVSEEVVLLLAEGEGPSERLEVVHVRDLSDLDGGGRVTGTAAASGPGKWTAALLDETAAAAYVRTAGGEVFTTLAGWGDAYLGMVTGNNRYFTFTPAAAEAAGLGADDLLRISPPGSSHLRGLTFTDTAWEDLGRQGRPTYLLCPGQLPSDAAQRLIDTGEALGVHHAYKCRMRRPWWRVPLVPAADLLLTYMNHDTPRLTTNRAKVWHLNSVHGITLTGSLRQLGLDLLPIAALNSVTLLGAELVGRAYGGGLLKIEPNEADRLPMPAPDVVRAAAPALRALRPQLTKALRAGDLVGAACQVDRVLLVPELGIRHRDLIAMREARANLFGRRVSRGPSSA